MRLSLTPKTSEFFVLFARAAENALEVARLVDRRFREHPNSGITQEQVKAEETEGDTIWFVAGPNRFHWPAPLPTPTASLCASAVLDDGVAPGRLEQVVAR